MRPDSNGYSAHDRFTAKVAERMYRAITEAEGEDTLRFRASGLRVNAGGRAYEEYKTGERVTASTVFIIEPPFRPSLDSCRDMVAEYQRRMAEGRQGGDLCVTYDQARWDDDPRIEQQIEREFGPSVSEASMTEAWMRGMAA